MKNLELYIDIREEMELIKEKQQEIILESGRPDQYVGEQMTSKDSKKSYCWEYPKKDCLFKDGKYNFDTKNIDINLNNKLKEYKN